MEYGQDNCIIRSDIGLPPFGVQLNTCPNADLFLIETLGKNGGNLIKNTGIFFQEHAFQDVAWKGPILFRDQWVDHFSCHAIHTVTASNMTHLFRSIKQ